LAFYRVRSEYYRVYPGVSPITAMPCLPAHRSSSTGYKRGQHFASTTFYGGRRYRTVTALLHYCVGVTLPPSGDRPRPFGEHLMVNLTRPKTPFLLYRYRAPATHTIAFGSPGDAANNLSFNAVRAVWKVISSMRIAGCHDWDVRWAHNAQRRHPHAVPSA